MGDKALAAQERDQGTDADVSVAAPRMGAQDRIGNAEIARRMRERGELREGSLPPGATAWQEPSLLRNLGESTQDLLISMFIDPISDALGPGEGGLASGMRPDRPGYKPVPDRKPLWEQAMDTVLSVPVVGGPGKAARGLKSLGDDGVEVIADNAKKWTDRGGPETLEAFKRAEYDGTAKTALERSYDAAKRPKDMASVKDEVLKRDTAVSRGEPVRRKLLEMTDNMDESIESAYRYKDDAGHGVIGTDRKPEFWSSKKTLEETVGETSSISFLSEQPAPAMGGAWYPGANFSWLRGMADRGATVHHITPEDALFRHDPTAGRVPTFTNEEARYLYDMGYTHRGNTLSPPPQMSELPKDAMSSLREAGEAVPAVVEGARAERKLDADD